MGPAPRRLCGWPPRPPQDVDSTGPADALTSQHSGTVTRDLRDFPALRSPVPYRRRTLASGRTPVSSGSLTRQEAGKGAGVQPEKFIAARDVRQSILALALIQETGLTHSPPMMPLPGSRPSSATPAGAPMHGTHPCSPRAWQSPGLKDKWRPQTSLPFPPQSHAGDAHVWTAAVTPGPGPRCTLLRQPPGFGAHALATEPVWGGRSERFLTLLGRLGPELQGPGCPEQAWNGDTSSRESRSWAHGRSGPRSGSRPGRQSWAPCSGGGAGQGPRAAESRGLSETAPEPGPALLGVCRLPFRGSSSSGQSLTLHRPPTQTRPW